MIAKLVNCCLEKNYKTSLEVLRFLLKDHVKWQQKRFLVYMMLL